MKRAAHVTGIVLERRTLQEQHRALAARIEAAREEERTSIARDLHDQLGQALTALKLDLGWLRRRIHDGDLDRKLDDMARATDEILGSIRRISAAVNTHSTTIEPVRSRTTRLFPLSSVISDSRSPGKWEHFEKIGALHAEHSTGPVGFQPMDTYDKRSRSASSTAHGAVSRTLILTA